MNAYEKINIGLIFLGIISSGLGFIITSLYNRSIKTKDARTIEIDNQIKELWNKNDDRVKEIMDISKLLNTIQGERNSEYKQQSNKRRSTDDPSGGDSI